MVPDNAGFPSLLGDGTENGKSPQRLGGGQSHPTHSSHQRLTHRCVFLRRHFQSNYPGNRRRHGSESAQRASVAVGHSSVFTDSGPTWEPKQGSLGRKTWWMPWTLVAGQQALWSSGVLSWQSHSGESHSDVHSSHDASIIPPPGASSSMHDVKFITTPAS